LNLLLDGLPGSVQIAGREVPIDTSFRTAILFEEAIQDIGLSDEQKIETALQLYYHDERITAGEVEEAVERMLWFYRCGADPETGESQTDNDDSKQSFSYEYDAEYIYAAFLQTYHIDLTHNSLHWWQFRALFRALPEDTQLMKIIGYRTMKIPPKTPKDQKQFYERMKRVYKLPESADRKQLENDLTEMLMKGGDVSSLLN
jgi:hypothetical protein